MINHCNAGVIADLEYITYTQTVQKLEEESN